MASCWRSLAQLLWPALIAGLVGAAITLIAASLAGVKLLADLVTEGATFVLGPEGFSFLLNQVGSNGKPLLFFGVILGQVAVFAFLSWAVNGRALGRALATGKDPLDNEVWLRPILRQAALATAIFLCASLALVAFAKADLTIRNSWGEYGLLLAATSLTYAAADWFLRVLFTAAAPVAEVGVAASDSRRRLLAGGAGLLLAAGATFVIGRRVLDTLGGGVQRSRRGVPTEAITPNEDFYVVSKNFVDPTVNELSWTLGVAGSTRRELVLTYEDVQARESRDITATLQCISNEVGGELIGNAVWTGFSLKALIEEAEPLPSASFVVFRSEDGYSESLPLEFALREEHTLAYLMNGVPLPDNHGFPLRLVTPGKYGIKNPKWLTQIILMDEEFFGFWQERGWSQDATMNTSCRIDAPTSGVIGTEPIQVHGIAFSGSRGIEKVEVTLDSGSTWQDAQLTPPLSPYSWVLWSYEWQAEKELGRARISARATDGTGAVQTSEERPPPPSGATGYPEVSLIIQEGETS